MIQSYLKKSSTKIRTMLIVAGLLIFSAVLHAQNLVVNSLFTNGSFAGWSTSTSYELYAEPTYGGTDASQWVTEIDVERTVNQQVCILPGLSYTFTYNAARRNTTGTPTAPGIKVRVTGVTSNTDYVNSVQSYTGTGWNVIANTFTVTIPAGATDKKVNISFVSNNNTTSYGVLIWDIELAPASSSPISIGGPSNSTVSAPNNFYVANAPASASYNWSFSADASQATSSSATPTAISWASAGSKTATVALTNGTCTMATYSKPVTISTILPVHLESFTGEIENNRGLLTWVSDNESNGRHFVIERSSDGSVYDSIGVVSSLNSSGAVTYHFTDNALLSGNGYYRLRHVDLDDAFMYSQVITLNNNQAVSSSKMKLYPNPAVAAMNYSITTGSAVRVSALIYNTSGVLVQSSQADLAAGVNQQTLNVSGLARGSYYLKVADGRGSFQYVQLFTKI